MNTKIKIGVLLGPYINPGVPGVPNCQKIATSSQWRHMDTKGKQFENQFFIYGLKCNKNVYVWLFKGPWGGLQWYDWVYLAFQLSSHPYICTCQIRKQSDKTFVCLDPKYEKSILFFILGGGGASWGPLCRTQVNENCRAERPQHRADICITRGKNNFQFFIYGPQYNKMCIFGYSGGPGWPIDNRTWPIVLPSYLSPISIYIYNMEVMR